MRVLLDTNIVINRETSTEPNYSIGHMYNWLHRLNNDILIHPFTVEEIFNYATEENRTLLQTKVDAYQVLASVIEPTQEFLELIESPRNMNDEIDNHLLYEVFCKRVDILITEDRRMLRKALQLGIQNQVFSINQYIGKVSAENPELISYSVLSVKRELFANIDYNDTFFDNFRRNYVGFNNWFMRNSNKHAYICKDDSDQLLGFLYVKIEDVDEVYQDITPIFQPKKRLKVGTFKVESTGFRLGERFIKIIFDNAIQYKVSEIYLTMFEEQEELIALKDLLVRWGFVHHGYKETESGREIVLTKTLSEYNNAKSPKENYPNVLFSRRKLFVPILAKYHTDLFPDSILNTEINEDFMEKKAYRYALQKVYISWTNDTNGAAPGDIVLFYRMGDRDPKRYSSVVTTIGIVESIIDGFENWDDFFSHCQNRSVFTTTELMSFWNDPWKRRNMKILKFIFVKNLTTRPTLDYLWENNIVTPGSGPRQFDDLSNEDFENIMNYSRTEYELFYS